MNKKSIAFLLLVLLVILWNVTVHYVDTKLENNSTSVYDGCDKIWSARGLYDSANSHSDQNSISSIRRAFEHKASGAEVDFYYDVKSNRFIVSHDKPKKGLNGELIYTEKEGGILTLEHLFKALGDGHYFWLDYKNLDRLSQPEADAAIKRLTAISNNSLRERLYIEGSNPLKLSVYTQAGFKTILGIHPLPESNVFSAIVVDAYKIAYYFSDITGLAMPYGKLGKPIYGPKTRERLLTIPVFLFHVPDEITLLNNLIQQEQLKVLLVGRDSSINRFSINACQL